MPIRRVIRVPPISVASLLSLKEQGFTIYGYCEGIKQAVQIRNISGDRVEVCHWGYYWMPLAKITKVVGSIVEPDQRNPWSESVTRTITPGGHK